MPRPFTACHKIDLDHIFKVTTTIENFAFETFERGTNCHLWGWKIFITSLDTSLKILPNTHQPDLFDLFQGYRSNRHLELKSMACTLNFM